METPQPDELIGRTFGGLYKIERHIRRGGMGAVYQARDQTNAANVAVKVVRPGLLEDAQAVARFKREIRLVTEIVHDNIVRALDSGDDDGFLWIAMELLNGDSLRERLDARGRMPWQETLPLIEQIVAALGAAHARGVIHRDLKPENVMLVEEGGKPKAKLLDFGVAKQARVEGDSSDTSNMTGTGLIIGTPGYVAPELVLEGITDDPRSDFYALGVTWFEMLTGQKPFTAKTAFALAMRHAHEPAPTPTSLVPFSPVPAPIERLVLRLMAKAPQERPANASDLLALLKTLGEESQRSLSAPTPPPAHSDLTVTDMGNGTGVVPFVGTPRPAPIAPPLGTPSQGLTTTSPTPGASYSPSQTPAPQLLQQLPRSWFVGAALVIVFAIVAGSVVSVFAMRHAQEEDREDAVALAAKVPVAAIEAPPIALPPPPPPVVAELPVAVPVVVEPVVPVEARAIEKREKREKREKIVKEPVKEDVVVVAGVGVLMVRPKPTSTVWKVGVDDRFPLEAPQRFDLTAGPHTLKLSSSSLNVSVTRTINVVAGTTVVFEENLAP
ncbi:MAG: serine/threonine-protein kinase [Deltaproteobacteria bacterium]|nr:serine/threonine-protein kinase [Deltaproteobacteria bacterium]